MSGKDVEWACPKCGAKANEHGKGGIEKCADSKDKTCMGFICDCDEDTSELHGESFADPCPNANCYHCHWGGTFPKKPKGLQAWEKKAIDAGWTMPAARRTELGLKS